MDILDFDVTDLDLLTETERASFVAAMATLAGGERLRDFVARVAPHEPIPRHLQPIVDVIEYARLRPVRVCFDIGPGHAKTTMLLRAIAWWLCPDQSPGDMCAYVSYSDGQARDKSRIAKETMESAGNKLSADQKAAGFWLTPQGGGLVAKGAQGGLTGKRVPGLLIYDDPYKDMQAARSQAINSMVIERFKAVAFTRLQGGSIIVLHTRWHVDDLIGYIMRELKWDQISIPTICEDEKTDILGRRKGEVAWPEKYPYEMCTNDDGSTRICGHDGHLKEIRITLGEHIFGAMYQGRPRPEGTAVFHEPARFRLKGSASHLASCRLGGTCNDPDHHPEFAWTGKRGVIAIDPAATAKTSSDWSVIMVCAMDGYGIKARMWIVDLVRQQIEIPRLVQLAYEMQQKYRLTIACEAVAGFKSVPQSLRAMNPRLRVVDVEVGGRDKYTRSMALAAAWNDGRVLVPMDVPWADTLINEFSRFTGSNDDHDDQVDAGAHAWNISYRVQPKITSANYAAGSV